MTVRSTLRFAPFLALLLLLFSIPGSLRAQEKALPVDAAEVQRVVGSPAGPPLSGEVLDRRTKEVASLLRCPVCQGLSVNDSPATMAQDMKQQVRDLLAIGFSRQQILDYFEHSYGQFVLLEPSFEGVNWLVWVAPILALVIGGGVVAMFLRRSPADESGEPNAGAVPAPDELPPDPELAACVLRVRELAYGWPGGRSPESASRSPEGEKA